MATNPAEVAGIFEKLRAPIPGDKVKTRKGKGGRELRYIQAPTVIERLDEAVGPGNWTLETTMAEAFVKVRLTLLLPDGRHVFRDGIGGYPDNQEMSQEDIVKGGASDALKRAGALFGIGLNLYEDAEPTYDHGQGSGAGTGSHGNTPIARDHINRQWGGPGSRPQQEQGGGKNYGPPRTGRALFGWIKNQEEKSGVELLKYINGWGKIQEFPGRVVDWDEEQVAQAYAEANRKLATLQTAGGGREPGDDDASTY
jgi:hypothetical protein